MRHDALANVRVSSAAGVLGLGLFNPHARRPLVLNGEAYIVNNGQLVRTNAPALLQYDEWKDIDRTVLETFTMRLQAVADLKAAGLVHPLGSIGVTVAMWEKVSDMTPADVSMSGITQGEEDTPAYELDQVPVPIVHKDFRVNLRRLHASRIHGEGIDVTAAAIATRLVAEQTEDLVIQGNSSVAVNGAQLYGYTSHPDRNTVDLTLPWDHDAKTGEDIVEDVQAMLAAARAKFIRGPFVVYIPLAYEGKLDSDYNPATSDTRTIRERIMQLEGISRITTLDRLPTDNVLLISLTREVVDWAEAEGINTVQWDEQGGLQVRYKVMSVGTPRIKSDYDGTCGVVHLFEIPT